MTEPTPFHRVFGLAWLDFFKGTDVTVEREVNLSIKQQFLDVVLIRKGPEPLALTLPDGFGGLAAHNLLTFKSYQEALDTWALRELIGHHVNYRKQSSPSLRELLPESDYRMFAICARFPRNLVQQGIEFQRVSDGVFDIPVLGTTIRVIVVAQLPLDEKNAMLHMFSDRVEMIEYSREHYRPNDSESSSLIFKLLRAIEVDMASTEELKQFARETITEILQSMPPERRMEGIPAEDRVKGMTAEELAKVLPPETLEALRKLPAKGKVMTGE